jgi:hypothetical protein
MNTAIIMNVMNKSKNQNDLKRIAAWPTPLANFAASLTATKNYPNAAMLNRTALLCSFLFIVFSQAVLADVSHCLNQAEKKRNGSYEHLRKVEEAYRDLSWQYKKWRELVYQGIWTAEQSKKDPVSDELRIGGQIRYERYVNLASVYAAQTGDIRRRLIQSLLMSRRYAMDLPNFCAAIGYQNCMEDWHEQAARQFFVLSKTLKRIIYEERRLNRIVLDSLPESPSDHTDYGKRLLLVQENWTVQYEPQLHILFRELEELLHYQVDWQECCNQCTAAELEASSRSLYLKNSSNDDSLRFSGGSGTLLKVLEEKRKAN